MSDYGSALYAGHVVHQRMRPRRHHLRYRVFLMLLDLDELPRLGRTLRLFAHNAFGLLSFHDKDHGDGDGQPLRFYVERQLREAGIAPDGGAIRLLCMPRFLGYVFNPISLYFCHRRDGDLAAIIYEVNNTFGQRHSYLIPVSGRERSNAVRQSCKKRFYVSPFMEMEMIYDFRVASPASWTSVVVHGRDAKGPMISTCFIGRRAELSDSTIAQACLKHPLLPLKVIAGIHWEALRLFLKGVRLVKRPEPPLLPVTIVPFDDA